MNPQSWRRTFDDAFKRATILKEKKLPYKQVVRSFPDTLGNRFYLSWTDGESMKQRMR